MNTLSPYAQIPPVRELLPIDDPQPGTPEAEMAALRHERNTKPDSMVWLPQLNDDWAQLIAERVDEAERSLAAPNRLNAEYALGTAQTDHEVVEVGPWYNGVLFSAEHATRTPRLNKETGLIEPGGFADVGTAGMTAVLAEDYGRGFIAVGRQTRQLSDPEHPVTTRLLEELPQHVGFISVHGCSSRMFIGQRDPTSVHAHLGLGIDPSDKEREYAEAIVKYGREELGLNVIIGNDQDYYVQTGPDGKLRRNDDGTPYRSRLAAPKLYMTTSVLRREAAAQGMPNFTTIQAELAPLLLPTAVDGGARKDPKAEVMGIGLGYMLLAKMSELALASSK